LDGTETSSPAPSLSCQTPASHISVSVSPTTRKTCGKTYMYIVWWEGLWQPHWMWLALSFSSTYCPFYLVWWLYLVSIRVENQIFIFS
jgi:hypothetical protein